MWPASGLQVRLRLNDKMLQQTGALSPHGLMVRTNHWRGNDADQERNDALEDAVIY